MRLFIVRHAQTSWNLEGRAQGSTDIPLDGHGKRQARALAEALGHLKQPTVYSSDLLRCRETAAAIVESTNGDLVLDQRLRERAMAEWEGLPFSELRRNLDAMNTIDDPFGLHARAPSGESIHDVWARLDPVVELLLADDGDRVVVSHGGTSALLLSKLIHGKPLTARGFRFGNATITELAPNHQGLLMIERLNDSKHLESLTTITGSLDGSIY